MGHKNSKQHDGNSPQETSNNNTTIATNNTNNNNVNNNINNAEHEPVTQSNFEAHLRRYQEHTDPPDAQAIGNWLYPPANPTCKPPNNPNYLQPLSKEFDHDIKLLFCADFLENQEFIEYVNKEIFKDEKPTRHEDHKCVGALGRKININFVGAAWWHSLGALYNSRDARASVLRNGKFHAAVVISELAPHEYLTRTIQEYVRHKDFPQFIVVLVLHTENITQEDKDNFFQKLDCPKLLKDCIVVRFIKVDPSSSPKTGELGPIESEICRLVHFLLIYVRPATKPKRLHTTSTSEACVMSGDLTNKENEVRRQYAADSTEIQEERTKLLAVLQDRARITGPEMDKLIGEFPKWLTRPIDPAKRTLLHLICGARKEEEEGLQKPVEFLLNQGADPNALDVQGKTPLHYACANGLAKSVQILVKQKGIKLNIKDYDSYATPLMRACYSLQVEIIPILVAAGADVRIPNAHDFTPMQYVRGYALEGSNPKCEEILSALGFPGTIDFPGID
eukprot:Phypoly_transcript_07061.p1 GENE.Phypoly_transcript_07061~~Phypoly_transcript_07061.p1  ORF type:complete len:507 (+),score=91.87 Phypoly_transcript_07061:109-1629(+)